ncbi:MAG: sulfotransferase [Roseibium sp.]|uniref:tetratricopeptide repeat-containing sulfotransferase family protein n=1 Tax=Roseibium sp. TaxID=1936156 RepID=UPI0026128763|nr:tetratricopeptide repeat-containing sulfotransferase family protein [Roseibium sp.]MCV0429337.1 sulfotransferase [Roseibium sp.]
MPNRSSQKLSLTNAITLAQKHFEAGELEACKYLCERILIAVPSHSMAYHLLGLVAFRGDHIEQALDYLEASLSLEPQNPMFLSNTVEVLRSGKRIGRAIDLGKRATKAAPQSAAAHSNLALAYYDDRQYDKAKVLHAKALELDPGYIASLNNLGSIAREEKDPEHAIEKYRSALQLDPLHEEAANNLVTVLIELDRLEAAQSEVSRILSRNSSNVDAICNQARIHLAYLELDNAEALFRKAMSLRPGLGSACLGLSQVLLEKNLPELALAAAEEALKNDPENPANLHQTGVCHSALSNSELAREFYVRALEIEPAFKASLIGRAHLHMELGEMNQARADLERVRQLDPADFSPLIGLSRINKIRDAEDPVFKALERQLSNAASMSPTNQIAYRFGLADCYDALGRCDEAWEQYTKGAALKRSKIHYDSEARDRQIDEIIARFTPEFIETLRPYANHSAKPIFVLGMPRSGTTLTETILASHPSVFGAGELGDLQRIFGFDRGDVRQPFPQNLSGLAGEDLVSRACHYVACLEAHSVNARHVTDKMPSNYNMIGLINALLPNAKIVHVSRNGMDTCLSCFTRLFERSQHQSYDLIELGRYYNGYRRLMNHWEKVLPPEAMYTLDYQSLVEDPEGQTRALLAACGLAWNKDCLEFQTAKRRVRTASITQVRQPVYRSSVEKWRRYEKHLKPLANLIGI